MAKFKIDQVGAWAVSVVATTVVFAPTLYFLSVADVEGEVFSIPEEKRVEATQVVEKDKPETLSGDFGYEGQNAPKNWNRLSSENYACSSGKEQSPVNVSKSDPMFAKGKLRTQYRPFRSKIQLTSNRLLAAYEGGKMGDRFFVQSFDFHIPSEHALEGRNFAAEIQIEHQSENGRMAQVSVFVEEGEENKFAKKLFATLSSQELANLELTQLLPKNQEYLQYFGSMTIPPCSEGVDRYVLTTPITFSKRQIDFLSEHLRFNARELQVHREQAPKAVSSN